MADANDMPLFEGQSLTGAGDIDAINPNDLTPKMPELPPMSEALQEYRQDIGLDEPPQFQEGTMDFNRAVLFDAQVNGIGGETDPFKMSKNSMGNFRDFNNQNHFYERYAEHSEFENLGFTPFRDNETLYNENSSTWQELGRASGEWASMISLGLVDAAGWSIGTDRENAEAMERSMAVGSSTKGGAGGFTTNLFLNSGYTVGIMAELALEEVAMIAAEAALGIGTVGTFGATAPL